MAYIEIYGGYVAEAILKAGCAFRHRYYDTVLDVRIFWCMGKCDHRWYSNRNVYYDLIFPKTYLEGDQLIYNPDGKGIWNIARFVDQTLRNEKKGHSFLFLLEFCRILMRIFCINAPLCKGVASGLLTLPYSFIITFFKWQRAMVCLTAIRP